MYSPPRRSSSSCERALDDPAAVHDRITSLSDGGEAWAIMKVVRPSSAGQRARMTASSASRSSWWARRGLSTGRVLKETPGHGDALPLAAGELGAARRRACLYFSGRRSTNSCALADRPPRAPPRPWPRACRRGCSRDCAAEEQRLLEHDADLPPQALEGDVADVTAVQEDPAGRGGVVEKRGIRLTTCSCGAGRTTIATTCPGSASRLTSLRVSLCGGVAEVHTFEPQVPAGDAHVHGAGLVADLRLKVREVERHLQLHEHVLERAHGRADRLERVVDRGDVPHHHEELPHREVSLHHLPRAVPQDQGGSRGGRRVDGEREQRLPHGHLHPLDDRPMACSRNRRARNLPPKARLTRSMETQWTIDSDRLLASPPPPLNVIQ